MAFEIWTIEDERALSAYTAARDRVRAAMAHGVYPNALAALAAYGALDAQLATLAAGAANHAELAAYHGALMAPVAPYVAALRGAMEQIAQIMQAIELAQPGTFGIDLPEVHNG